MLILIEFVLKDFKFNIPLSVNLRYWAILSIFIYILYLSVYLPISASIRYGFQSV